MAYKLMTKVAKPLNPDGGSVYFESLTTSAPGNSTTVVMPYDEIYDMAFTLEGAGTDFLDVTHDNPTVIIAGNGTSGVTFVPWNGTDPISLAITGFRLRSTVGAGALRATVKTKT